jgi:protein-S-isoprenylcysteine O-methyltransferase Ste14
MLLVVVVVALGWFVFQRAPQSGWTLGEIYVGLFISHVAMCHVWVLFWNPVVIERRMFPGPGVKSWDWIWTVAFIAIVVAVIIVAVQDLETHARNPPGIAWLMGLAIFVPGWALVTWSMSVNPFFEKQVRIQTDHGHHVIEGGPYACVRHPGYVGLGAVLFSTPLLLNSISTLFPTLIAMVLFVIRTLLEDRMLQAELPGYREYASRVRHRLIPAIW